ncbi:unnamed protein product [Victoria cruziana]
MEMDTGETAFDLDFHPSSPIVATALIDGHLHLYRYDADSGLRRTLDVPVHDESCRAVRFLKSGSVVLTSSADHSIVATDLETGRPTARMENAHGDAVNRLVNLTETTISSGDDMGCIKVWDTRQNTCCKSFNAHEEYITDMIFVPSSMQLLATSGDGTLSVCNLHKNKVQSRSDCYDCDLLSVVLMKDGKKVLCGAQNGDILLYSWGHFEDCSDRFLGHPNSVQTLLKLDEDTLISGCEDGVIRLLGVLPNRIIQPIAEHSDFAVEGLAFSHDRKFLGSISHDQMLKLWDLPYLLENWQNDPSKSTTSVDSDDMDVDTETLKAPKVCKKKKKKANKGGPPNSSASDFFADL